MILPSISAPSNNARAGFAIVPWFGLNIAAFERSWYRQHAVSADDAGEFREQGVRA